MPNRDLYSSFVTSMKNTQYDSIPVAKCLLALANDKGVVLNATQLQKLLFIVYGVLLAKNGLPILTETPKAWPFGPVFPRLQKRVNTGQVYRLDDPEILDVKKNTELTDVLNTVIDKYSVYTASKLTAWSHKENSPWELTVRNDGIKSQAIPDAYILEYFKKHSL